MIECKEPFLHRVYRTYFEKYRFFRVLKDTAAPFGNVKNYVRNNFGIVSSLRFFYRRYLKQYYVFRYLKDLILPVARTSFRPIRYGLRKLRAKKFKMISMSDFKGKHACETKLVEPSGVVEIPGPRFFGEVPSALEYEKKVRLESPRLELVHICNSVVVGGTNFIISGKHVIYPDLFIPTRDVPPAETFGVATLEPNVGLMTFSFSGIPKSELGAISLLGQCTGNYAHWLTETLPKLLVINKYVEYDDLPLLVDGWIHPVFFDTIELINKKRRKILRVERWQSVSLMGVIDISPPAYVPPEYREFVEKGKVPKTSYDVFPFSPYALNLLRDAAHEAIKNNDSVTGASKRLYLRRSQATCGNARNILNIAIVEELLTQHGFKAVEPALLAFEDQVRLFRDAEIIVSPVGAALANTIFTKPGCKIVALSPYYENANYYYFSNLMGALEHELYYVLGPQIDMQGHPLHKNYNIDVSALKDALSTLCPGY